MLNPLRNLALGFFLATTITAFDAPTMADDVLRCVRDDTTGTILDGDRPIVRYRYADVAKKPYVDQLFTPSGVQILRDSPDDHKHHHGLMFAIAADGVNFWEESEANSGTEKGENFKEIPDGFEQDVSWIDPSSEKPVLVERRTIEAIPSADLGATLIEWCTTLETSPDRDEVVLDGHPYYGLGMRFVQSMDVGGRLFNADDKPGELIEGDHRLTSTRWCAYTAKADGKPVTVAIFDHPTNPRRPATMFTMQMPFAYLSATLNAWREPIALKAGQPMELRYGVALWDGEVDKSTVEQLYQRWLNLTAVDKSPSKSAALSVPPQPLWRFAWVSDMHMGSASPEYIAKAFRFIDEQWKPNFAMFTGDNNFVEAAPNPADPTETKELRRQRYLKDFFEKNLKTPFVVIPGDNWPAEFDRVFGPKQYSFDYGGIHFVMLAPDRIYHGKKHEGLSVFDKPTMDWIAEDLEHSAGRPTVVAIHEPIYPPTFLDAPQLYEMLKPCSNVVAVLQGHLHVGMEFHRNGVAYLVAPSLGKPPSKAMRLVEIFPDKMLIRTAAYEKDGDRFVVGRDTQEIRIPKPLRDTLSSPAPGAEIFGNYDAVPAHPLMIDPSLESRSGELIKNALKAVLPFP